MHRRRAHDRDRIDPEGLSRVRGCSRMQSDFDPAVRRIARSLVHRATGPYCGRPRVVVEAHYICGPRAAEARERLVEVLIELLEGRRRA